MGFFTFLCFSFVQSYFHIHYVHHYFKKIKADYTLQPAFEIINFRKII